MKSSLNSSSMPTVTVERKEELLLEARKVRLSWIRSSSFPFIELTTDVDANPNANADGDDNGDPLSLIKSKCEELNMTSLGPIMELLLEGKSRHDIQTIASTFTSTPTNKTNYQVENKEDDFANQMTKTDDHAFLFYYRDVLDKLCLPECAEILQTMRHFERTFADLSQKIQTKHHNDGSSKDKGNQENIIIDVADIKPLSLGIQKYLSKLYESLSTHTLWKNMLSLETKMMIETFIYCKCHNSIQTVLSLINVTQEKHDNDNFIHEEKNQQGPTRLTLREDEASMVKRIKLLQFVEPKHLDMHSILYDDTSDDDNADTNTNHERMEHMWKMKLDLSKPISLVQSLDKMYSPSQMLRCILEIYRGVNESLTQYLSQQNFKKEGGGSGGDNVSADDILPTLILTVLHAKPTRIISVLTFLENFATEDQLRGESGYAYTNLYSAVQFIKGLELYLDEDDIQINKDCDDGEEEEKQRNDSKSLITSTSMGEEGTKDNSGYKKPTLSMSPEILKEKIKLFRQQMISTSTDSITKENDLKTTMDDNNEQVDMISTASKQEKDVPSLLPFQRIDIPIHEIKAARLRGENLKEWASQWAEHHYSNFFYAKSNLERKASVDEQNDDIRDLNTPCHLPDGFSRTYTFIGTEAKDIKLSDLPKLLDEYRMLVKTTETLIMQRNSSVQRIQNEKVKVKRKQLENALEEVMKPDALNGVSGEKYEL
mmetsp:Transcript_24488/g.30120  ORF Transcript_24488/g.30120 Transcript_24488/m.30120 type:complete len:714 (-) Transcript_24488:47-2188(-)